MFRKEVWVAWVSLQYNQAETIKKMVVYQADCKKFLI